MNLELTPAGLSLPPFVQATISHMQLKWLLLELELGVGPSHVMSLVSGTPNLVSVFTPAKIFVCRVLGFLVTPPLPSTC